MRIIKSIGLTPFWLAFGMLSLASRPAGAVLTSQISLTGGYWEGLDRKHQIATLVNWRADHIAANGVETSLDFGLNNDIAQNQWSFYPYQAFVKVPLGVPRAEAPWRCSRLQLGRQLLTEGFELTLLDGAQLPYYWSESGGVWIFAGGSQFIENNRLSFDSQIYGVSVFERFAGFHGRAGYVEKSRDGRTQDLLHAELLRAWEGLPLRPTLLLKGQVDTGALSRLNQALVDSQLVTSESTSLVLGYSQRDANRLYSGEGEALYRLFAISPVRSENASFSWSPSWRLSAGVTFRRLAYRSTGGEQTGYQADLYTIHRFGRSSVAPVLTYLESYGLPTYALGARYRRTLSELVQFQTEANVARLRKPNGIEGWAYHARSGFDFTPLARLLVRTLLELESNPIFSFDARVAVYASYFYF